MDDPEDIPDEVREAFAEFDLDFNGEPTHFNQAGQPMGALQWALAFEDTEGRIIRKSELRGRGEAVTVSTVWLGLDHRMLGGGPPLIFESMVFGGPLDQEQWRYSTRDEAIAGHEALVKACELAESRDS